MGISTDLWFRLKDASQVMANTCCSQCVDSGSAFVVAKDNAYHVAGLYREACNKERMDLLIDSKFKKVPLTDQQSDWCEALFNHGVLYSKKHLIKLAGSFA